MQIDIDTVITVLSFVVAVAVLWQLRNTLGKRTGHERPPEDLFNRLRPQEKAAAAPLFLEKVKVAQEAPTPVSPEVLQEIAPKGTALYKDLCMVVKHDPFFDPKACKRQLMDLYEEIMIAYSGNDVERLRSLLEPDAFEDFAKAIQERIEAKERLDFTLVSFKKAAFTNLSVEKEELLVQMRFVCEVLSACYDEADVCIEGSKDHMSLTEDLWTFARPLKAPLSPWLLVATQ